MEKLEKDIVIIGGGPGGYESAIRAAQLGASVTLIEKENLGGTCLNWGCVPTKTLYRNAEIINTLKDLDSFGIEIEGYKIDVEKIQKRKEEVINKLRSGIESLIKGNKIEQIMGTAQIKDKNTVVITKEDEVISIKTKNIIIATGSEPAKLNIPGGDNEEIWSSKEILDFKEIPENLLIIGAGVIGMEFAGIFNSFGSKVTVVEFMPSILSNLDLDITKRYSLLAKKKGIDIYTKTKVNRIEKNGDKFTIYGEGPKGDMIFEVDKVLIATGRIPYINSLNVEEMGIKYNKKGITVDENFQTNIEGIYAIGDVNGISMLAHAASFQGIHVVEKIMGEVTSISNFIPSCIFLFPEIATVGITEEEAKNKNIAYKTGKFMFGGNCKALALGETDGFVKVITSEDDKIIGVHIMGPHASDIISEGIIAVNKNMSIDELKNIIHPHPTLSEAFYEAALDVNGMGIHIMPSRKKSPLH